MFKIWRRRTEENQLGTLKVIRESIQDKIEELRGPRKAADIAAWRAAKARQKAQQDRAILIWTEDASENPVATGRDLGAAEAQEASTNASGDALPGDK
ncbi:hypothetical protein P167DRAFT_579138 [Morchella conica CCBAS932]|uniref:Uncharacterized protein n=1 Tax=Morchella conica CCBAS932 TaxID=1392247 RepID=A0A3N4KDG7_9PEZI|nr:hypothetical protein P167DRAFT_579138 [Morchella conica CCBAS932]